MFYERNLRERNVVLQALNFSSLTSSQLLMEEDDAHLYKTEISKPSVHSLCGISGTVQAWQLLNKKKQKVSEVSRSSKRNSSDLGWPSTSVIDFI